MFVFISQQHRKPGEDGRAIVDVAETDRAGTGRE